MQNREAFIQHHKQLFWYFDPKQLNEMSDDVLLEFVLNYGDLHAVKELLNLFGIAYAGQLFAGHTQAGKRHNYLPQVANYFNHYFRHHPTSTSPSPLAFSSDQRLATIDKKLCQMPNLLTLAAMKAYAIGRRAKWKDYVDLYVLLTKYFSVADISDKATQIFGDAFSEKLFRQQLAWYNEMDYSEAIDWVWPATPEKVIQETLTELAMI